MYKTTEADMIQFKTFIDFVVETLDKRGNNINEIEKLKAISSMLRQNKITTSSQWKKVYDFLKTVYHGMLRKKIKFPNHIDVKLFSDTYKMSTMSLKPSSIINIEDSSSDDEVQFVASSRTCEYSKNSREQTFKTEVLKYEISTSDVEEDTEQQIFKAIDEINLNDITCFDSNENLNETKLFHRRITPEKKYLRSSLIKDCLHETQMESAKNTEIDVILSDDECDQSGNCEINMHDMDLDRISSNDLKKELCRLQAEFNINDISKVLEIGSKALRSNPLYINQNDPRYASVTAHIPKTKHTTQAYSTTNNNQKKSDVIEGSEQSGEFSPISNTPCAVVNKTNGYTNLQENCSTSEKIAWLKQNLNKLNVDTVNSIFQICKQFLNESNSEEQNTSTQSNKPRKRLLSVSRELDQLNRDLRESFIGDDIEYLPQRRNSSIKACARIKALRNSLQLSDSDYEPENSAKQNRKIISKRRKSCFVSRKEVEINENKARTSKSSDGARLLNKKKANNLSKRRYSLGTDEYLKSIQKVLPEETEIVSDVNWTLVPLNGVPERSEISSKKTAPQKKIQLKNTNIHHTFDNKEFNKACVICAVRPQNTVCHYITKHKSEVYTSRFTAMEIKRLNQFPVLGVSSLMHSKECGTVYKVTCPICHIEIIYPFEQILFHLSTHTGEFSFMCSVCKVVKPYKKQIDEHILQNKRCSMATSAQWYRYKSNNEINMYYCSICNYIQINEGNIVKHIRHEHEIDANHTNTKKILLMKLSDPVKIQSSIKVERHNETKRSACDADFNNIMVAINVNPIRHNEKNTSGDIQSTFVKNNSIASDVIDSLQDINEANFSEIINCKIELDPWIANISDDSLNNPSTSNALDNEHCRVSHDNRNNTLEYQEVPLPLIEDEEIDIKPNVNELVNSIMFDESSPNGNISDKTRLSVFDEIESTLATLNYSESDCSTNQLSSENMANCISNGTKRSATKDPNTLSPNLHKRIKCALSNVDNIICSFYKCMFSKCRFASYSRIKLTMHLNNVHSGPTFEKSLKCSYCDKTDKNSDRLIDHMTKHAKCKYQCCHCNYRAFCASNVVVHNRLIHPSIANTQILLCVPANSTEYSKDLTEILCFCPICPESLKSVDRLKAHIDSKHSIASRAKYSGNFICIYCKYAANEQIQIEDHLSQNHQEESMFICELLDKNTKKSSPYVCVRVINIDNKTTEEMLTYCN